jgi:hypothetical protein
VKYSSISWKIEIDCPLEDIYSRTDDPEFELSVRLLDHGELMTPFLRQHFGDIYARQWDVSESEGMYRRTSSIFQTASSHRILDAELDIFITRLPEEIVKSLRSTSTPFGQLLIDNGIRAEARNRKLFKQQHDDDAPVRLGRRHKIIDSKTGSTICEVVELFAPENVLITARNLFLHRVN